MSSEKKKIFYFDYIRVIASFAVMSVHNIADKWGTADLHTYEWNVYNFIDAVGRWSVISFILISGALFLNREIPLKKLYSKYILRICIVYIFWSVVYGIEKEGSFTVKFYKFLNGPTHLWYLVMLIGLYMCTPFIRSVIEDRKRMYYFLGLTLLFNFIIPSVITVIHDFGGSVINRLIVPIEYKLSVIDLGMVIGFTGYYVLGFFIHNASLEKKQRMLIYAVGLLGFAATIFLTRSISYKLDEPKDNYYAHISLNVMLEAIAVFTWFKYRNYTNNKLNSVMSFLAKYSFGAYLVHGVVRHQIPNIIFLPVEKYTFLVSFTNSVIVFIISYLISFLLSKIPFVSKYIV